MFYQNLIAFCAKKNTNPTALCREIGLATSAATRWKEGSVPRDSTLKRIADRLGVSVTELLDGKAVASSFHSFTQEEILIIEAYRSASQERKESVMLLLGLETEQKKTDQKQTDIV